MGEKKLTDYIETKDEVLIQAYIDRDLYTQVKKTKKKIKWKELIEASFKKFLDENQSR